MPTRREALLEAFNEAETEESKTSAEGKGPEEELEARGAGQSSETKPDSQGVEGKGQGDTGEVGDDKKLDEKPETPDAAEARAAAEAQRKEPQRTEGVLTRAPNSWKPAERESWAKVPAEARAAIVRREKQIEQELSQTANVRKFSNELARIIQPHSANIQAAGTTPLAAIDTLLKTASSLQQGSANQKAEIIANLIHQNAVDIKVLDDILSKRPINQPQGGTQQSPNVPPPWAQPLFSFMNSVEQTRQQHEQQLTESANAEIESASQDLPFFEDLRLDIADVLESAARRGKVMTLKEAYDRAAALDPEVSKILDQRRLAARQSTDLSGKKRAAKTISGAPSGGKEGGGNQKPASRREALAQAWDNATEA